MYNWFVCVGLLVAGSCYAYKNYLSKKAIAKKIVKSGKHSNPDALVKFDRAFLQEWASAAKNQEMYFIYRNNTYNTQGGTVKK